MAEGRRAGRGDTVRIHYTGTLDDGSVFDSSRGRRPLEFTVGGGQVIPGFDAAVTGMAVGEEKTVTIPAAQAYGDRREDYEMTVERGQLPDDIDPAVGDQLQMSDGTNQFLVRVSAATKETVTLDANHPLAGKDLTFALELMEIVTR